MSTAIGSLRYSDPRAVQVREPENVPEGAEAHSAVHGDVAVYTNSVEQWQAVIAAWPEIMGAAAAKADEVLAQFPMPAPAESANGTG